VSNTCYNVSNTCYNVSEQPLQEHQLKNSIKWKFNKVEKCNLQVKNAKRN